MNRKATSKLVISEGRVDYATNDVIGKIKEQFGRGVYTSKRRTADNQPAPVSSAAFNQSQTFLNRPGTQDYSWFVHGTPTILDQVELTYVIHTDGASEAVGDTYERKNPVWKELVYYYDQEEVARFIADDNLVRYTVSDADMKRMDAINGTYCTDTVTAAGAQTLNGSIILPTPWDLGASENRESSEGIIMLRGVEEMKLSITWADPSWIECSNAATTFVAEYCQPSLVQRFYAPAVLNKLFAPLNGNHMLAYYRGLPRNRTKFSTDGNGQIEEVSVNMSSVNNELVLGLFVYVVPTASASDPFTMVDWETNGGSDSIRLEFNSNLVYGRDRVSQLKLDYHRVANRAVPSLTAPAINSGDTPTGISGSDSAAERSIVPIMFSTSSILEIQECSGLLFPKSSNAELRFLNMRGMPANTDLTMYVVPIAKRAYSFN